MTLEYDVIVVGCGHAGCEAAAAAANLGSKTLLIGLNIDTIALMPCNPAIGGPAKSHLVREIDALGGVMGLAADATYLQTKLLNSSKGAAVHALRAQSDKYEYSIWMRNHLENITNLDLYQAMVTDIIVENNSIVGVRTRLDEVIKARAVIITSGTFLQGKVFSGQQSYSSGRAGESAAVGLTISLQQHGIETGRLKTGTPPRLDKRTINFEILERHPGDAGGHYFSFLPDRPHRPQYDCYSTRTMPLTHELIKNNIHKTPLYSGMIEGRGPRYCPSIEDKIIRFATKESHNLFLEPESLHTNEIYLQGFSTSFDVGMQRQLVHSLPGLEQAVIIRPAYAVEYDFVKPIQMKPTLETKKIHGLFVAGQVLGTSGYEEAAAQGLIAGINAHHYIHNLNEFILSRTESYIGTLIDDLIYKEITEPYRMLTSRSEYRLYLRQDNADIRLTPLGRQIGLVNDYRYQVFQEKQKYYQEELSLLKTTKVSPENAPECLNLKKTHSLEELLTRVDVNYSHIDSILGREKNQSSYIPRFEIETEIKYAGYIKKQKAEVEKLQKMQSKTIPENFDYNRITHISSESREKLSKLRPKNLQEAARIDGVRQTDLNILALYL